MSNSSLVDVTDNVDDNFDGLKKGLDSLSEDKSGKDPEGKGGDEDKLPEKYRNKSKEDIIKMHQNAESELGRRGNELGQYKSLTDQLLNLKRTDDLVKGGADPDEIEVEIPKISSKDLLDDPTGAVDKVVNARLSATEQKREKDEAEKEALELQSRFQQKHPDAVQVVNDPDFLEWTKESPSRLAMAQAASAGNLGAGDILLDEWKARDAGSDDSGDDDSDEEEGDPNIEAARKAGTESAGQSQTGDAKKGPQIRRTDLIRLKMYQPEVYAEREQEILKAYAEGRVI